MVRVMRLVLVLVVLTAVAAVASAQDAIVLAAAPIYVYPDSSRTPLRTASADTRLRVVEERADGWVRVEFQDPQYGRRVGYVESRFLRIVRPNEQPLDLSVPEAPEAAPAPAAVPLRRATDADAPERLRRGWIDVNFGGAFARERNYATEYRFVVFDETAQGRVDYTLPSGAAFDFGGGVMLTRQFGLGVSFAGTAHQHPADLYLRIPHPLYANAFAEDSAPTDEDLQRIESQTNIQAMFAADLTPAVRVRAFAGPTFFRARQDVVSDVKYVQDFGIFTTANAIAITRYQTTQVDFDEAGGWGFHVGADVSWFFTGVVGVGGFGRYASGTVGYADPLTDERRELKVGGFQGGGGLRLRF